MNLSKDQLVLLLTVLDKGSFSAAARALGRAPSAVSMAIASLEDDLNLQLFDRSGREPQPTAQALTLAVQARALVQQMQQWEAQALAMSSGLESKLSIAIEPELLSIHWADYLATLALQYPALEVEVVTAPHEDAMVMLHEGRVQLALLYERAEYDGRENFQEVLSEQLIAVVAANHPLAQQPDVDFQTLMQTRQLVVASRDQPHLKPRLLMSNFFWRTDSHIAALSLVLKGVGWAILPRTLVQPDVEHKRLRALQPDSFNNSFPLCVDLVWSEQHALGIAARSMIAMVKQDYATQQAVMPKLAGSAK